MTRLIPAIFEQGHFTPTTPLSIPDHQRVFIAVTIAEDDVPSLWVSRLAEESGNYDFLSDPAEDIYSASDGEEIE